MSETDSFIQEVTEEVRQDQMFALWKKWAPLILGGVAVIVGGAAYWSWSQSQQKAAAEERGGLFLAADPDTTDLQVALPDQLEGPAKVLGQMTAAGALAEQGDAAEAGKRFAAIAADGAAPQVYRDLALLQAVRLGAAAEPEADLERLIEGDGAFRLLALEVRAALRLEAGDAEAAHADLNTILLDPLATRTIRQRAAAIITATGGAVDQPGG